MKLTDLLQRVLCRLPLEEMITSISLRSIQYRLLDYTRLIVSEYEKILRQMYNLGGRRVLVTSTRPLGCAPGVKATRSRNGECAAQLQQELRFLTHS
ncbi:hypothetical protein SUGI_0244880 [Cryptomeria japonica]|nr:hypothetical protein SUGI_0244880 [Cryptomeria japonica]